MAQADTLQILENIRGAVEAGGDWVQIREKDLPARELLELARQAVQVAAERREGNPRLARIIVNDRLDVALAAGAHGVHGVHLGHESLDAGDAIPWCRAGHAPAGFAIGNSFNRL